MYQRIFDGTMKFCKWFLIVDMILIISMVTLQVVSRYVFNNPSMWSEEVAVYGLVYFTFIGNALAISQKQTLKITILADALREDKAILLNLFTNALSILLLIFVIVFSPKVFSGLMNYLTPALRIPKSFIFLSVPLGSLVMIMAFANEIMELLTEYKTLNGEKSLKPAKKNKVFFKEGE